MSDRRPDRPDRDRPAGTGRHGGHHGRPRRTTGAGPRVGAARHRGLSGRQPGRAPRAWRPSARAERFYSRYANPTVTAFEDAVAELEGAEAALAFASGMGAVATVVLALCSPRRPHRRPAPDLLRHAAVPAGRVPPLRHRRDLRRRHRARRASPRRCGPGRRCWWSPRRRPTRSSRSSTSTSSAPSPGPFTRGRLDLRHADRAAAARPRRRPGAPLGHQGHRRPQRRHARRGGRQRPSCSTAIWALRGPARRLRVALRRHERPAGHPHAAGPHRAPERDRPAPGRVAGGATRPWPCVRYPGLPSHPQHDLAKRQMAYGGRCWPSTWPAGSTPAGRLRRGRAAGPAWPRRSAVPRRWSTSPANSTHVGLSPDELAAAGIGPGLVRVSVGLEHPDDLVADFAQALP